MNPTSADSRWASPTVNPKEQTEGSPGLTGHLPACRSFPGGLSCQTGGAWATVRRVFSLPRSPLYRHFPPGATLPPRHRVLWVGPTTDPDLGLARRQVAEVADVRDAASPAAATAAPPEVFRYRSPAVVLLASLTPGQWTLADVVNLKIYWPLAPIVSVAAGLLDGRRRSGPQLPGMEEVPWHDLGGRLGWWLADREAGRPGGLGMPGSARREERFLEPVAGLGHQPMRVTVAAQRVADVEAIVDLLAAAGVITAHQTHGRPSLIQPADLLVWDVGMGSDADLAWLRMLVANQPGRRVVLLDSFPRADTVVAALRAGASAVLGRPTSAEALAGTVLRLAGPQRIGLGPSAHNT